MLVLLLWLLVAPGAAQAPPAPLPWTEDLVRIGAQEDTPVARAAVEARLAGLAADAALDLGLVEVLDPTGAADSRGFATRLSALSVLVARAERTPVPVPVATALFTVHVRSRTGDLPEDPDLFERALRGLLELPPEALRDALGPGLARGLRDLAHAQLLRRWALPLAAGEAEALQRTLESWPLREPHAWEAAAEPLSRGLEAAFDQHGKALVAAMQTDGGSLTVELVARAEAALLAEWVGAADPRVARIAAEIARDKGVGRAILVQALRARAARPGAGEAAAAAASRALGHLGDPPPDLPLAPPLAPPGQVEGLGSALPEVLPEGVSRHAATEAGSGGPRPLAALLVGGGGLVLAGLLASRRRLRPLAALLLGLASLPLAEGLLGVAGVRPLALERPLFSFTDWQVDLFRELPDGRLATGPGSVRYQELSAAPQGRTLRVAVLGASSAHGSNHLREEAFAALLEGRLVDADRPVEVLNLGIGGTISSGVLHAGRQALDRGAELLVVYYGHNEVAQFTRLALYEHVSPAALGARLLLHRSHLYSALARLLLPDGGEALAPVSGSLYAEEEPGRAEVEVLKELARLHLRHNLHQLLSEAAAAGAGAIIVEPATNYRFAHLQPFPDPGPGSAEDLAARQASAEELARQGRGARARAAWQEAIDVSASPREITGPVRAVLRELALDHGAGFLDADALFYAASPDGLTANGLFWDDLHPSREGHALLAEALEPLVRARADRGPALPDPEPPP